MKKACLVLGLLTLALIWAGPLLSAWRTSFAAHMLAHMGVVSVAAPLIAIGASGKMPAVKPSLPLIASLVELVVVWGWHAPATRLWAETSVFAAVLEQSSFLIAGPFLWTACLAPVEKPAQLASGALALLLTSIHMTLLGALLSLASRPLYGVGEVNPIHPVHAILLAFPFPMFLAALVSDVAYWQTFQIQWANFSAWLIAAGLLGGGLALLWALVDLFRFRDTGFGRSQTYFAVLLVMFVLGFINALVHAKDAAATMPAGLYLSIIATLLALVAAGIGYSGFRSVEVRDA